MDIDDVVGAIRFIRENDDLVGPVNIAAPYPTDNRGLMRTLRQAARMPIGLPAWRWMLEPAMWLLRTEPELVLKSRWVMPARLTAAGFQFTRPTLQEAVRAADDALRPARS